MRTFQYWSVVPDSSGTQTLETWSKHIDAERAAASRFGPVGRVIGRHTYRRTAVRSGELATLVTFERFEPNSTLALVDSDV